MVELLPRSGDLVFGRPAVVGVALSGNYLADEPARFLVH
jgi:hypothetical protein